jgi:hypothetical protein
MGKKNNNKDDKDDNKGKDKKEIKSSYLERAFMKFVNDKLFGGFVNVMEKRLLPFTITGLGLVAASMIFQIFFFFGIVSGGIVKQILLLGFLTSTCYVVLGILAAVWKNYNFQVVLILSGVGLSAFYIFYFNPDPQLVVFQVMKLAFLIIWVLISTISIFFVMFYFFTSLSSKLITAGKSKEHIFLGKLIRFVAAAVIGLCIWLILANMGSPNAYIIGGLGILTSSLLLKFSTSRNPDDNNFITILGLYNFYIAYQISASVMHSDSIPNILTELLLLVFTALYSISNMTTKIKEITTDQLDDIDKKRKVFFQTRFNLFAKLKRKFGDISLILVALGCAMGYFLFILSVYIDPEIPIVGEFFDMDLGLPVFTARIFSFVSLMVFLVMYITYKTSEGFRESSLNNYSFKQGMKIVGDKIGAWGRRVKGRFQFRKNKKGELKTDKKAEKDQQKKAEKKAGKKAEKDQQKNSEDEEFLEFIDENN